MPKGIGLVRMRQEMGLVNVFLIVSRRRRINGIVNLF
jgi:hypothetical protein